MGAHDAACAQGCGGVAMRRDLLRTDAVCGLGRGCARVRACDKLEHNAVTGLGVSHPLSAPSDCPRCAAPRAPGVLTAPALHPTCWVRAWEDGDTRRVYVTPRGREAASRQLRNPGVASPLAEVTSYIWLCMCRPAVQAGRARAVAVRRRLTASTPSLPPPGHRNPRAKACLSIAPARVQQLPNISCPGPTGGQTQ